MSSLLEQMAVSLGFKVDRIWKTEGYWKCKTKAPKVKRRDKYLFWEEIEDSLKDNKLNDEKLQVSQNMSMPSHLLFILPSINSVKYKCWNIYESSSDS